MFFLYLPAVGGDASPFLYMCGILVVSPDGSVECPPAYDERVWMWLWWQWRKMTAGIQTAAVCPMYFTANGCERHIILIWCTLTEFVWISLETFWCNPLLSFSSYIFYLMSHLLSLLPLFFHCLLHIIRSHYLRTCGPWLLRAQTGWTSAEICFSLSLQFSCSLYRGLRHLNKRAMKIRKNRTGTVKRWKIIHKQINDFLSDISIYRMTPAVVFLPLKNISRSKPCKVPGIQWVFTVVLILATLWVLND